MKGTQRVRFYPTGPDPRPDQLPTSRKKPGTTKGGILLHSSTSSSKKNQVYKVFTWNLMTMTMKMRNIISSIYNKKINNK